MSQKGMNNWLVAFCWAVIFAGLYSFWRTYSFTHANPTSELPGSWSDLVQTIVTGGSIGAVIFGVIFAGWHGGIVVGLLVTFAVTLVKSGVF